MKYAFHPEAEAEFLEAIDYYENSRKGLGAEFAVEVYSTIERILAYPKAWPVLTGDIRRSQTVRFPYAVLYAEDSESIFVLAIMHLHREPGYWKHRS